MKNVHTNATTYRNSSFVIIISHVIIPVHLKTWSKPQKTLSMKSATVHPV